MTSEKPDSTNPHRKRKNASTKHQAMRKPYPKPGPLLLIDFLMRMTHDLVRVHSWGHRSVG